MSELLKWTALVLLGGAGLFALDRLLLKAEEAGYIYYRKKKAMLRSVGSALVEFHQVLEPTKRYVVEAKQEVHEVQNDDDGAPPDPGHDGELILVVQGDPPPDDRKKP